MDILVEGILVSTLSTFSATIGPRPSVGKDPLETGEEEVASNTAEDTWSILASNAGFIGCEGEGTCLKFE